MSKQDKPQNKRLQEILALDSHHDFCNYLRKYTRELFIDARRGNSGIYHAIDAFEREPELLAKIEELESKLGLFLQEDQTLPFFDQLTNKQRVMYESIISFMRKHGYPPTVRELRALSGLKSTSTVHGYLGRLRDKGYISWDPVIARSIQITEKKIIGEETHIYF